MASKAHHLRQPHAQPIHHSTVEQVIRVRRRQLDKLEQEEVERARSF